MILEYGVKNYFCFKEWTTISFRLNQQCPVNISQGEEFTKILGVKGANASGKTNILKALNFLSVFCSMSFNDKPEKEIGVRSFFYGDKPTEFYVEFKSKDILYRYEVELTQERIYRETIYRTIKRESKIIERIDNKLKICNREFSNLKVINLRNNASIISTAHQYEIKELDDLYVFFKYISTNVNLYGLEEATPDLNRMSKFFEKNTEYFNFAEKLIIRYDPDVKNIEIYTREDKVGDTVYFPVFNYDVDSPKNFLTFHDQSSGTKALYLQLARYKFSLDNGSLLVLDEFDINLHPDILPDLLSLFLNEKINNNQAQLIFTTHNTAILDYLGKYRAYLVNKENNESYAYRLDEIPGDILRNDRDITPVYRSGKIGGIPKF